MVVLNAYRLNKENRHLLQLRVRETKVEAVRLAKLLTEEEISQLSALEQRDVCKLTKPKTPRVVRKPQVDKTASYDLPWLT